MKPFLILILSLSFTLTAFGQQKSKIATKAKAKSQQDTINFYSQIKDFNLAIIFSPDSFSATDPWAHRIRVKRDEPLGCIDTNYTRFYIHIISATKNKDNPYEYEIIGRTKVKNNICDFKGTITFKKAEVYTSEEFPKFKVGFAVGEILFYEDTNQVGSGVIKGKMMTYFYIDKKGQPKYNSLEWGADAFFNNEVVCNWTSYKTKRTKKCSWGDYRIPESGDLDMGAAMFSPSDKYLKNGWEDYRLSLFGDDSSAVKKANQIEAYQWWKK
jgi:hypothetical protein